MVFNESDFRRNTEKVNQQQETIEVDTEPETSAQPREPENLRRSERTRRPPVRYGLDEYADTAFDDVEHIACYTSQLPEPQSMEEALASEFSEEKWKGVAECEYSALMENWTWELVPLPSNRKPIGCKWVFKAKRGSDGAVERFKARLVAKGYAQQYGVDYDETFSPVVRFSSIRLLLAYAVQNDMIVHQMDVVNAFLNSTLDEEIYMEQPPGYTQKGKEHLVCRLKKSLYGLKQSPRCWNKRFRAYMEEIQFRESQADPYVFIHSEGTEVSIVAVYVDDLIIVAKSSDRMREIKESMATKFRMKDLGKLHYCLGITVEHDEHERSFVLHQRQYIFAMFEKYGLSQAKTVSTPADVNVKLTKDDGVSKSIDAVKYQSMVGSLLYASTATRPDIAQAVGAVAKFCSQPTEAHLTAAKRIFRYLKGTADLGL